MQHPSDIIHTQITAARDLTHLFVGTKLGWGTCRSVWTVEHDPTLVIKWEPGGKDFQNILEWSVWKAVEAFPDMAKWFAPCVDISPNGQWLLQKRCKLLPKDRYPTRIPDFLGDLKYKNFGLLGKRVVAMDYGVPGLTRLMHFRKKLVKADWWGEDPSDG